MSKPTRRRSSLRELVTETPISAEDVETADLKYIEKQAASSSKTQEVYASIKQHMQELDGVEARLTERVRIKSSFFLYGLNSVVQAVRGSFSSNYRPATVDDLVLEQIGIMNALSGDVGRAVRHTNTEAGHLQKYGGHVMEEFESAKTCMQRTNIKYANTLDEIATLEAELADTKMEDKHYTEQKVRHDDAKRTMQKLFNKREIYAARVKFRIVERKDILAKEDNIRAALYELQKMGDYLGMFLENVEETFSYTNVVQAAYQTADALRDSYKMLLDIEQSRGIIARGSTERLATSANEIDYEFPEDSLTNSLQQKEQLKSAKTGSTFDEVSRLLSMPIIEREPVIKPSNGHVSSYEAQKELVEGLA